MFVKTKFNSVRVSIDGLKEINDTQRGNGCYDKAIEGINTLYLEKEKVGAKIPYIGILFTLTPLNYHNIEQFLLNEINLNAINSVTIQVEKYLTEEMGLVYSKFLKKQLNISNEKYWRALLRNTEYFNDINTLQIAHQVENVKQRFRELNKDLRLLPPTYTHENLSAYFNANWNEMTDKYFSCPVPWYACDITANGDVAPCHIFYDLIVGNLHEQPFHKIWNGDKYNIFRDYMKEHKLMSVC